MPSAYYTNKILYPTDIVTYEVFKMNAGCENNICLTYKEELRIFMSLAIPCTIKINQLEASN